MSTRFSRVAVVVIVALAAVPTAQAATVTTVAKGLDNPRGVAVGPDGAVDVANAGTGGKTCEGKGEDRFCTGTTARVVKVVDGKVRELPPGGMLG